MRIYIAGKITNNPDYIEQFAKAENELKKQGYEVINPVKEEGLEYKWYIDEGLKQLMTCDAIYMLKNWQQSKGASLERRYAGAVGLKIIEQEKTAKRWNMENKNETNTI